jgi:N-acetylglucosaminyl-diphospho-decaprenol L-rhamnosyltransferase
VPTLQPPPLPPPPPSPDGVRAAIITVSFNSGRFLARQIAALKAQTRQDFLWIVWDNASTPDQAPDPAALAHFQQKRRHGFGSENASNQKLRPLSNGAEAEEETATLFSSPTDSPCLESGPAPFARLMPSPTNLGFAAGNNRAVEAALAAAPGVELLVFLNPDAFPEPEWLDALLAASARLPHALAFGSTQLDAQDPARLDGLGDVLHATGLAYRAGFGARRPAPALGRADVESFAACGAAMAVRPAAFTAAGGFDERFFCYFEDVDLCFRLRLMGGVVAQLARARVAHVGGGSQAGPGRSSAFADFHGARNRLWCFVKNMPPGLFWPLALAHIGATLTVAGVHVAQGRGLASLRGIAAGLAGLGPVWRARRAIQAKRRAAHGRIARALAWGPWVFFGRQPVLRPIHPVD